MDVTNILDVSASGLTAARIRLETVSANLANAKTTRTPGGGPYQRIVPIFESTEVDPFGDALERVVSGVSVADLRQIPGGTAVYEPTHPDANAQGYVMYPDIDPLHEMVDLMLTSRAYEANAKVADTTYELMQRALEIGR
jgi:flagellar basal-body rod protein FlgC